MKLKYLAAPFPKANVHWRAQSLTRDGTKAMALAYLDARDVQDRLDLVCGPAGWQVLYDETPRGRIIARIGIRIGDEWVWKADGAGDTAVEGEKGGISDAFKRAAVPWGVGRYLYRFDAPWVPCETYERNGKKAFSRWAEDPWKFARNAPASPEDAARDLFTRLKNGDTLTSADKQTIDAAEVLLPQAHAHILALLEAQKKDKSTGD